MFGDLYSQLFDYLYDIAWHCDSVFGRLYCLDMCMFFHDYDLMYLVWIYGYP